MGKMDDVCDDEKRIRVNRREKEGSYFFKSKGPSQVIGRDK